MVEGMHFNSRRVVIFLTVILAGAFALALLFLVFTVLRWTPTTSDESIITQQPCAPPCWHGLIPGRSTQQDVHAALENDAFIPNWLIHEEPGLIRWQWSQNHQGYFLFDAGGILRAMSISPNFRFSIEDMLALYGEPAAIRQSRLMRTNSASTVAVQLSFYYPSQGLVLHLWLEDEPKESFVITAAIDGDEFELFQPSDSLEQFILQVHSRLDPVDLDAFVDDELTLGWPGYGSIVTARSGESPFLEPMIIVTSTPGQAP